MARSSARTRAVATQPPHRPAAGNGTRNPRAVAHSESPRPRTATTPSRWRQPTAFALSALALAVSIYLTEQHYADPNHVFACSGHGAINCAKVLTSPESVIVGIPVAVLGLAFYAVMFALNTPYAWRTTREWVAPLRLAAIIAGMGFVLYLLSVELFDVKAICEYCTSVHVFTFVLFVILVTGWEDTLAYRGTAKSRRTASVDALEDPAPDAA